MDGSELGQIDLEKIVSFRTVLAELASLNIKFRDNKIRQFTAFNKAYEIVMSRIETASKQDIFEHPKLIEAFSTTFSRFYFNAVNERLGSTNSSVVAWYKMALASSIPSTPTFILLLMGANAHINHDLPLALLEVLKPNTPTDLLKDLIALDKILMTSGREIITSFQEPRKWLDIIRRRFQFLYYRPIMYMILFWRARAWTVYKTLANDDKPNDGPERQSIKIANHLFVIAAHI